MRRLPPKVDHINRSIAAFQLYAAKADLSNKGSSSRVAVRGSFVTARNAKDTPTVQVFGFKYLLKGVRPGQEAPARPTIHSQQ